MTASNFSAHSSGRTADSVTVFPDFLAIWANSLRVAESAVLPLECAEKFDAVMTQLDDDRVFSSLTALRTQPGQKIIPVITDQGGYIWLKKEKHICRDTTASGGNVDLLMS